MNAGLLIRSIDRYRAEINRIVSEVTQVAFLVTVCGRIMEIVDDIADGLNVRCRIIRDDHHGQ